MHAMFGFSGIDRPPCPTLRRPIATKERKETLLLLAFPAERNERKILRQLPLAVLAFGLINYRIPLTLAIASHRAIRSSVSLFFYLSLSRNPKRKT